MKNQKVQKATKNHDGGEEIRHVLVTTVEMDTQFTVDSHRYSSWLKPRRVTAWVIRFTSNCQKQKEERTSGELQTDELKITEAQLIEEGQRVEFKEEWTALSRGKPLPSCSKLMGLKPILDEDGLMRCDGSLAHAKFLSFDVRYPIILPRKSWVTKLIIKEYHENGKHASGTIQLLRCQHDTG